MNNGGEDDSEDEDSTEDTRVSGRLGHDDFSAVLCITCADTAEAIEFESFFERGSVLLSFVVCACACVNLVVGLHMMFGLRCGCACGCGCVTWCAEDTVLAM